jgi:hypothetical protein
MRGKPTPDPAALLALAQESEWLRRAEDRIAKIPTDPTILKELAAVAHELAGRQSLPVTRSRADLGVLQEENAWCLAARNRVAEIATSYGTVKIAIDEVADAAESELQKLPGFWLLPNERARGLVVGTCLPRLVACRQFVRKVVAACDTLRDALTHQHFTIKQHADLGIAMTTERSA